jgi:hypothetical protein
MTSSTAVLDFYSQYPLISILIWGILGLVFLIYWVWLIGVLLRNKR